ncbi:uncharacterized protein IUM83_10699 [Phytophthora cinnamomi]|uniref:uncharacterized protein n=1 Tax=Phytophthora cinnamomi TaxID=4785 RepID=UPI0035596697|nr:hypothetical protein IUM83_10699 [Phytophthora cinnamomi]
MLDSDTSLYGEDCGYSDPNAKPKNPPTDGTATFERGLAHPGPCEIWLDDKMVLHNDDCAQAFSTKNYMSIKSKFKPVDYSSCSSSGCMFRFYWLAFQLGPNSKSKYSWQIYKNCIPLTGPAAGQTSTFASNTTQSADESSAGSSTTETPAANPPASGDQTPQAPTSTDAPEKQASKSAADTPAPETQASEDTLAPETQASESAADTPAPITPTTTENCKAPQRKRA